MLSGLKKEYEEYIINQEQEWFRIGLVLTRADMAYWVIRCSEEWFLPIYWKIYEQLLKSEVPHMDELCSATHNSSYALS